MQSSINKETNIEGPEDMKIDIVNNKSNVTKTKAEKKINNKTGFKKVKRKISAATTKKVMKINAKEEVDKTQPNHALIKLLTEQDIENRKKRLK